MSSYKMDFSSYRIMPGFSKSSHIYNWHVAVLIYKSALYVDKIYDYNIIDVDEGIQLQEQEYVAMHFIINHNCMNAVYL